MKLYYYRSVDNDKRIVKGKLMSENRKTAVADLKRRSLIPLSVKKRSVFSLDLKELFTINKPLSPKTLYILTSRLYVMTDSGLDFQKALSLITEQSKKDKRLFDILFQVKIKVSTGDSLTEAFSSFSCFPDFFISMVEIGERSGSLPIVFLELSRFYEWEDKSVSDVKSAMLYPIIVSVLLFGVVIAALTVIIPAYSQIFISNGILLPLPTRILISLSDFFIANYLIIAIVTAILILCTAIFLKFPKGKSAVNYLQLNFPIIKNIYTALLNYRLAHAISILLSSGVSLTMALEHAFRALNSPCLTRRLNKIISDVNKGESLGSSIKNIRYFDKVLISMIETGEETGRLPYMLGISSEHLKSELERTVKNLNVLIEPTVTILLGIVICVVLLAVVLPSFSLMEAM